jgi:hypothetical protein
MRITSPEQLHALSSAVDLMREYTPAKEQTLRHALRACGYEVETQAPDSTLAASCSPEHNPLHVPLPLPSGEPE